MRPLLEVFIDAGCRLPDEPGVRRLAAKPIDLLRDADQLETGGVLLLGASTSDRAPSLRALKKLRRLNQHVIVFGCAHPDSLMIEDLASYTRGGLDRLFIVSSSRDVADLMQCVKQRVLAPPPGEALCAVSELGLDARRVRLLIHILRNSQCEESMEEVAARFGRSLRTLEDWVASKALPVPTDLFRCGRYLHLRRLYSIGVRSVAEQARRLGFPTATDLRQWRWRLRQSAREDPRLRAFSSTVAGLHPLLAGREEEV